MATGITTITRIPTIVVALGEVATVASVKHKKTSSRFFYIASFYCSQIYLTDKSNL